MLFNLVILFSVVVICYTTYNVSWLYAQYNVVALKQGKQTVMTRNTFMEFFRDDDDDHMGSLSVEDRIEIFRSVLLGSSDFTTKLLNEVLRDYCAYHLIVLDTLLLEASELENTFTDFFRDYSEDPVALAKYVREYLGVGNETST